MSKNSAPKKQTFPVFLLAGVLLLFALGIEVVRVYVYETDSQTQPKKSDAIVLPDVAKDPVRKSQKEKAEGNVFENIHTRYPGYKTPYERLEKTPLEFFAHNPSFGRRDAPVRLDIFTDTDCVPCREEVNYVLAEIEPYMQDMNIIYRFLPTRGKEIRGGVFDQIAQRAGIFTPYFQEVMRTEKQMAAEEYLLVLEKNGIDLMEQRRYMTDEMRFVVKDVKKDIQYAEKKEIFGPPQFYLNGYLLGQESLPLADIAYYTSRLRTKRTIIPE